MSTWFAGYRIPPSDAGALMTAASKILAGAVYYRDIDSYPLPGSHYLLAAGMGLFGEHLSVARGLATVFYCVTVMCLYGVAVRLIGNGRAALFGLTLICFKFLAWPGFTSYTYWDVSLAFASATTLLLVGHPFRGASVRLVAAGFLAAAATLCKQNLGIYLCGASLFVLAFGERIVGRGRGPAGGWRQPAAFACGMLLAFLPVALYFASQGVLGAMLHSGFVRPFTSYAGTSGVPFLEALEWWDLGSMRGRKALTYFVEPYAKMLREGLLPGEALYPAYRIAGELFSRTLYTLMPVAFLAAVWLCWRGRGPNAGGGDRRLLVFAVLAAAVALSAFPRADFTHVIGVYPVVALLLFAVATPLLNARPGLRRVEGACVVALVLLCGTLSVVHHSKITRRMTLERADLWVYPDSYLESVVRFLQEELEPGDSLFVYGNDAHYYFLTGHYFDWPFSQLYPGQTGPDQGRLLTRALAESPPKFIVRGILSWPGLPPIPSYAPFVDRFVRRSYRDDDRVFERYPIVEGRPPSKAILSVLAHVAAPPPAPARPERRPRRGGGRMGGHR